MVNTDLILVFVSVIVGSGFVYFFFIPRDERTIQLDQWLGIAIAFFLGYKLLPILYTPSIVLKPIQLLTLKSGDLGLILGFIFAIVYWFAVHVKQRYTLAAHYIFVLIALIASYTVYSVLAFETYGGHYLGLYRFIAGGLFLIGIKFKKHLFRILFVLYGGILLIIQTGSYSQWYGPFSLIQWFILVMILLYFLITIKYREERTEWQEK